MRRKDREISDYNEIVYVMNRCEVLRIGMVDSEGKPYIVPLTFGLDLEGEKVTVISIRKMVCVRYKYCVPVLPFALN